MWPPLPSLSNLIYNLGAQKGLPLGSGVFLASPIPAGYSIAKSKMDAIITQAIHDAESSGSTGSDNTPFVLNRIHQVTNGESARANRALVEANVARGTRVAVHLASLDNSACSINR